MLQLENDLGLLSIVQKDTGREHAEKSISVWKEFGVKNNDELVKTLMNDWNLILCKCGNVVDITNCGYNFGNPICGKCHRSLG